LLNAAKKALDQAGLSIEDHRCYSASGKPALMEAIADRLGISRDKMFVTWIVTATRPAAAVCNRARRSES